MLCGTVGVISTSSEISIASLIDGENARSINKFSTTPSSPAFGVSSENQTIDPELVLRTSSGSDLFNIVF